MLRSMVAPNPRPMDRPASHPRTQAGQAGQAEWLVLALEGSALQLATHARRVDLHVTGDVDRFRALLVADRPQLVVCSEPPAEAETILLVLKERRRRALMRAVHVSPPPDIQTRLAALAAGFDDAVPSTMPVAELLGRLEWLDARAHDRPDRRGVVAVAEGVTLDLVAHELRRAGRSLHLRPKEYALLALLATNPRRVFSRQQILAQVWGPGQAQPTRTVDVHVRWIREKIEPDPSQPAHLVTVRGVGYRLDPLG
jgi:DNA-binding response OmpR family regulator